MCVRESRHSRVEHGASHGLLLIVIDPVSLSREELNRSLARAHAIEQASLQLGLATQKYRGGTHRVADVRSQRLSERCEAKAPFRIRRQHSGGSKGPQNTMEDSGISSGGLRQFRATL